MLREFGSKVWGGISSVISTLFSEPKATLASLRFVGSIDLFGDVARAAKEAELGDHWGLPALREWEDRGVG